MTEQQIKGYRQYWRSKAEKNKDALQSWQFLGLATREMLNDQYVVASDMVEICDLALCQMYDNEARKKG